MSKKILVEEGTGKKFEALYVGPCFDGDAYRLKEIVEPVMEVGDWYILIKDSYVYLWDGGNFDLEVKKQNDIIEVRKTNREHWKRIDGEWRKIDE